jgi:hypothetical protein
MNKSDKIREHFRKYPNAEVAKVAAKFQAPVPMTYKLRKQALDGVIPPPAMVPMPETAPAAEVSIGEVLQERENRYGTFESNARTCQLFKNVLHAQHGWYELSYVQREALEMMMHKVSRLVNGDSTYLDTVIDIAGYNQLMLEHMRNRNEGNEVE